MSIVYSSFAARPRFGRGSAATEACRPVSTMNAPACGCSTRKQGIGSVIHRDRGMCSPSPRRSQPGPAGRCSSAGGESMFAVRSGCTRTPAPSRPPGSGSDSVGIAAIARRAYSLTARMDASELLRPGVLEGATIVLTDDACGPSLRALGAKTPVLPFPMALDEDALAAAAAELGPADAIVCDGRAPFQQAGGGLPGLRAAADGCFAAARAI